MKLLLALALIAPAAYAARNAETTSATSSGTCKHDSQTAKSTLAAIYAGQRALHTEKSYYSPEFGDIGYDPNISLEDNEDCDLTNWSFEITSATPDSFTATAYSRVNGQEFVINEKKDITKKDLKISSSPVE